VKVLVCVKRVPETGARISLTADAQAVDDTFLGHTISPHEECAVEEALRIVSQHGGSTTVLTLGPAAAAEQLRDAIAMGIDDGILLETDGSDWDPQATAAAIAGFFALPLVGSPATVVDGMVALSAAGVDGLALSWLDYPAGLRQYRDELLPRLARAGLRKE
jgi:alkanesulfonate monooxygenase SsuD/methylene tetrahydromethanopterin reductase-like flavin-dependent oxidoreductase (luciferase family)